MARITITSKDAERIVKSFDDLIGPKGLDRIRRKAVNEIGSGLRKDLRSIGPVVFHTSAAALMVQGRSAAPGATDPAYKLRMARTIPVERLKAKARPISRSKGRKRLSVTLPGDAGRIAFRSVFKDGSRIRLHQAGPLRERGLAPVFTNPGTAFERYPELSGLRRRGQKDLVQAVADAINNHLSRRRR